MKMLAARFLPHTELKAELEKLILENSITSGFVMTAVGSLHSITIRMAGAQPDKQDIRTLEGHFEIVSLVGTLSREGAHLHISVSDSDGAVVGGHLKAAIVTTTAEVVIGYDETTTFKRQLDPEIGFEELSVRKDIHNTERP